MYSPLLATKLASPNLYFLQFYFAEMTLSSDGNQREIFASRHSEAPLTDLDQVDGAYKRAIGESYQHSLATMDNFRSMLSR